MATSDPERILGSRTATAGQKAAALMSMGAAAVETARSHTAGAPAGSTGHQRYSAPPSYTPRVEDTYTPPPRETYTPPTPSSDAGTGESVGRDGWGSGGADPFAGIDFGD